MKLTWFKPICAFVMLLAIWLMPINALADQSGPNTNSTSISRKCSGAEGSSLFATVTNISGKDLVGTARFVSPSLEVQNLGSVTILAGKSSEFRSFKVDAKFNDEAIFLVYSWNNNTVDQIKWSPCTDEVLPYGAATIIIKTEDGAPLGPDTRICVGGECINTRDRVSSTASTITYVFGPMESGPQIFDVSFSQPYLGFSSYLDIKPNQQILETRTLSLSPQTEPTVPVGPDVYAVSVERVCNDYFGSAMIKVHNAFDEYVNFTWNLKTASGVVLDSGNAGVGVDYTATVPTQAFSPEYAEQAIIATISPVGMAATTASAPPCTPVDPGPQPTVPVIPTPTIAPAVNTFTLISANRACADQTFAATWTGNNLKTVEFALSNTSDEWTSGWLSANAPSGTFTAPVDHHGYDKVMARATFTDDAIAQQDADVGTCTEVPAPPAPQPPAPAPSPPGGVTSLPQTGSGSSVNSSAMLLATVAAMVGVGIVGLRKRTHI